MSWDLVHTVSQSCLNDSVDLKVSGKLYFELNSVHSVSQSCLNDTVGLKASDEAHFELGFGSHCQSKLFE